MKKINIKRYRTAHSLVREYMLRLAGRRTDWQGYEVGCLDENGRRWGFDLQGFQDAVARQGLWGFADHTRREIHYWAAPAVSRGEIAVFFAHEFGHLTGRRFKGLVAEEKRAEAFADVTRCALESAGILRVRRRRRI